MPSSGRHSPAARSLASARIKTRCVKEPASIRRSLDAGAADAQRLGEVDRYKPATATATQVYYSGAR